MRICYLSVLIIALVFFISGCLNSNMVPGDCPEGETYNVIMDTNTTIFNAEEAYTTILEYKGEAWLRELVFSNITLWNTGDSVEAWYVEDSYGIDGSPAIGKDGIIYSKRGGCE